VSTDVLKFYDKFGVKLVQGYGSTETALRVTGVEWADLEYSIPLYPAGEYLLTFEAKSVEQYGEHALVVGVEVNTGQVVEMGEYQGELLIVGTLYTVRAIFMSSQDGRPIFALIEVVKVESVVEPTPAIIGDQV